MTAHDDATGPTERESAAETGQTPLIQKYIEAGDSRIIDDSDFARQWEIDPKVINRAMKIVENDDRDLLAVLTSDMAAHAGTYSGELDNPWMSSVFIDMVTGNARFLDASFGPETDQTVARGNCTHFD